MSQASGAAYRVDDAPSPAARTIIEDRIDTDRIGGLDRK
jgi:hypothetical protein